MQRRTDHAGCRLQRRQFRAAYGSTCLALVERDASGEFAADENRHDGLAPPTATAHAADAVCGRRALAVVQAQAPAGAQFREQACKVPLVDITHRGVAEA